MPSADPVSLLRNTSGIQLLPATSPTRYPQDPATTIFCLDYSSFLLTGFPASPFVSIIFLNTVAILLLLNLNRILLPKCLQHLHIFLRAETKKVLCGGLQGLTQSLLSSSGFLPDIKSYTSLLCRCYCRHTGFLAKHTVDTGALHWPFPPG